MEVADPFGISMRERIFGEKSSSCVDVCQGGKGLCNSLLSFAQAQISLSNKYHKETSMKANTISIKSNRGVINDYNEPIHSRVAETDTSRYRKTITNP